MTQTIPLAILALLFFSGCSFVNDSMRVSEKNSIWNPVETLAGKKQSDDDEALSPETMAVIWNFGVYEQPGSPSVRGLGGRIYFYDKNNAAVTAKGELTVYGFDEENGTQTQPDKKFVFRESEFQSHFSESALGGSYSVWIPWDKVGGYRKSVTLLPVFKTSDGKIIRSEQSINLLAGKVKKENTVDSKHPYRVLGSSSALLGNPSDPRAESGGIAQASFNQGDDDSGNYHQRIRTTAISLTPNLSRQVELAGQNPSSQKPHAVAPVQQNVTRIPTTVSPADEVFAIQPAARTSTSTGAFGRPGAFR